jgi:hypothetical protein
VSEATVYRLLKAHDLITSPAFIVMKAANEFQDKTTAPNEMWQCVFHGILGSDSTGRWAAIPRHRGQGFHAIVGTLI